MSNSESGSGPTLLGKGTQPSVDEICSLLIGKLGAVHFSLSYVCPKEDIAYVESSEDWGWSVSQIRDSRICFVGNGKLALKWSC